jgi:WD40 repeat protein
VTQRFRNSLVARWTQIRDFWQGVKLAKASVLSVLFGMLLYSSVRQVQDLFLEVRGSGLMDGLFWTSFYLILLIGWVIPVYVCARWILSRFSEGPWAIRSGVADIIPPLLAVLCVTAVLVGQLAALDSSPAIADFDKVDAGSSQLQPCPTKDREQCGTVNWLLQPLTEIAIVIGALSGPERVIPRVYVILGSVVVWLLTRPLLRRIAPRAARLTMATLWWTVTVVLVMPIALVAFFVLATMIRLQLHHPLNLGHLPFLPIVTALIAWAVWWALQPRPQEPMRLARLPMFVSGLSTTAATPASNDRLLIAVFFSLLAVTAASILVLLLAHPAEIATHLHRALMLPALLGLFVPVFTYMTYWSSRSQAPLVAAMIAIVALLAARYAHTNDVRTLPTATQRPTLDDTVARWAAANDCDLRAVDTARECPQPIVVAAAGGASRAAFFVGSLLGKLLDETYFEAEGASNYASEALSYAQGNRDLVSLIRGGRADLWNVATGRHVSTLDGHNDRIWSLMLNADQRRALTLSADGTVRLWEADSGRTLAVLKAEGRRTNRAVFSPDGKRVLAALADGTARLWESETGKPLAVVAKHNAEVTDAQFSADGRRIITASADWSARIWDVAADDEVGTPLWGHKKPLISATFSPDAQRILTLSKDGTARLWNATSGAQIAAFRGDVSGISMAAFAPDGERVVTLAPPKDARIWNAGTGMEILRIDTGVEVGRLLWSPDGRRLVATTGYTAILWDAASGRNIAYLDGYHLPLFSPDGKRIIRVGDRRIFIFDAEDARLISEVDFDQSVVGAAISPTGERIAVASIQSEGVASADTLSLLDATTGARSSSFSVAADRQRRPLRPFGKQLFAVSAVSGGALSAVVTYAALADSQTANRGSNGPGKPPCQATASDGDWFAPYVRTRAPARPEAVSSPADIWRPHQSWKGCLQLILAGDFLSPVFVSLVSNDLLQIGRRGDRAVALEQAWERRYARMTGQANAAANSSSAATLAEALIAVRKRVLDAEPKNWLPMLLLNGTSVTTGKRIVGSDVNTLARVKTGRMIKEETGPFGFDLHPKYRTERVTERVFNDAYDFHELLLGNYDELRSETSDFRLSTGTTLSARFPIISPHGVVRSADRKVVDRIVDGGYYENFGTTTSLELVRALRAYGLDPFVIVVNNEPLAFSMDCVRDYDTLALPTAPPTTTLSTVTSPINALLATGTARALHSTVQLCSDVGRDNFTYITVSAGQRNAQKGLSMSWWLSMHVQKYLDDQLKDNGINEEAFRKIRRARSWVPFAASTSDAR